MPACSSTASWFPHEGPQLPRPHGGMNAPNQSPQPDPTPRNERLQRWIAALLSALLHVLFLLLVLYAARQEVVTTPQGAAGGGRVRVNFLGEPAESPETQAPPSPAPSAPPKPATREVRKPEPPRKPVAQAKYILRVEEPQPEASTRPSDTAGKDAVRPPASSPAQAQRRPHEWTGRPPGMLEEETGPAVSGPSRGPANKPGRGHDLDAAEPSVEVGGYQIIYDLLAEERLRSWKEQGMEEISFPLPGLRSRMVCPLEIALRRGSGKCRLLDPADPQMQGIGDARQVVVVVAVYHLGELVWRGPGPYR